MAEEYRKSQSLRLLPSHYLVLREKLISSSFLIYSYFNIGFFFQNNGFSECKEAFSTAQHIVFRDKEGRTVDLHLFEYAPDGRILYEGEFYPADTFSGKGRIAGKEVVCVPPAAQVAFHVGYVFDDNDIKDVLSLCRRFHIPIPPEYQPYVDGTSISE